MPQEIIDKILLVGASLALFLSLLFLRKTRKGLHDYIISVWLIYLGLYVGLYAFSPSSLFYNSWVINFFIALLFLNGPFLYTYVKAITHSGFKLKLSESIHLIPFSLFVIYFSVFPPFGNADLTIEFPGKLPITYFVFLVFLALSVPVYIYFSHRILVNHRKLIADNFSDLKRITLTWLRNLIIVLGIVWIMLALIIFIHHILMWFTDSFCINGLFITLSAFIVLVGYFGLFQPQIFISQEKSSLVDKIEKPYAGSSLKEEEIRKYLTLLENYMVKEKPYLNNQLTLLQLATELDIPLHHLSRIVNEYYKQNFFDFINYYRVNEFVSRLSDPHYSKYSLLAIAFDCGFNSKTTFNRCFKKSIGLTPSQYKNKQEQQ